MQPVCMPLTLKPFSEVVVSEVFPFLKHKQYWEATLSYEWDPGVFVVPVQALLLFLFINTTLQWWHHLINKKIELNDWNMPRSTVALWPPAGYWLGPHGAAK